MNDIERIHLHYLETSSMISAKESDLSLSPTERNNWAQVRDANDQAYFALIFAQFEDVVNNLCVALVRKMRTEPQWSVKRSWDVINISDLDRFSFMNRVALLTEKGSTDYNDVETYYKRRCEIDHGKAVPPISVTTVGDKLFDIAQRMRKNI